MFPADMDIKMMGKNKRENYISSAQYSFGGIGFSVTNMIVLTYLAFFCTDVFGVSSMTVAGLMLVTKVIDAVTDPMMGLIADRTRSKLGRYRPYLMFGAPVLGATIYMLFSAPDLPPAMKVVFLYAAYIGYSLAFTVVGVPFTALVPIVARDPKQRTLVVSWKNIMIQAGRIFITAFSLPMVEFLGGGVTGWRNYGIIIGVIITLCFWIVAWGAKPYDTIDFEVKKQKIDMKSEINLIVKNKSLLMLMIAFGTDMIANATLFAVNMYYFKYVLERQDLVPVAAMALTVTGVVTNLVLPALSERIGKKRLYWWGSLLSIIPLAVLLVQPVVPVSVLLLSIGAFGLISAIPSSLAWAMLPDCIDYSEYVSGIKGSGVVSSTFSFMNKLGSAFGAFIASFLLGLVGFVANQPQTKSVLAMVVFLRFGVPILGYIASLISMHFYDMTEERHAQIRKELKERAERKG